MRLFWSPRSLCEERRIYSSNWRPFLFVLSGRSERWDSPSLSINENVPTHLRESLLRILTQAPEHVNSWLCAVYSQCECFKVHWCLLFVYCFPNLPLVWPKSHLYAVLRLFSEALGPTRWVQAGEWGITSDSCRIWLRTTEKYGNPAVMCRWSQKIRTGSLRVKCLSF